MKVTILTLPLNENYGGILQSVALQKHLKAEGFSVKTFKWAPTLNRTSRLTAFTSKLKWLIYHYKNRICPWKILAKKLKARAYFYRSFLANNLDETPMCFNTNHVGRKDKWVSDCWVVGSDQVWRFWACKTPAFWMLNFIPEKTRRNSISYAASFGSNSLKINKKDQDELTHYAQELKVLSVREEQGSALCQKHFHVHAQIVPDPTILLKSEDYIAICEKAAHQWPKDYHGQYIAYYVLDMTQEKQNYLQKLSKKSGLPLVDMMFNPILDADKVLFRPIEQWLDVVRNAYYVVTDSFHGTVFSLIFNRSFSLFNNNHRGSDRFTTLFNAIKTDIKIAHPEEEPQFHHIATDTWVQINKEMDEFRNIGKDFLSTHLGTFK